MAQEQTGGRGMARAFRAAFPHTIPVLTGSPILSMQFVAITLLSIGGGTLVYMLLVQVIFA